MYNRYMSTGFDELFTTVSETPDADFAPAAEIKEEAAIPASTESAAPAKGGGLSSILEKINLSFDMDTIVILLIVFFLLTDSNGGKGFGEVLGENSDLLLIIGLLLIMGF